MADKRRFEQNQRWLAPLRRDIASLQEYVIGCAIGCTKEDPGVSWDEIEKRIKAISAAVVYGQQNDKPTR